MTNALYGPNKIEPYIRAGTQAVTDAASQAADAAKQAVNNFQQTSQAQRPNYNMVSPAQGPARNQPSNPLLGFDASNPISDFAKDAYAYTRDTLIPGAGRALDQGRELVQSVTGSSTRPRGSLNEVTPQGQRRNTDLSAFTVGSLNGSPITALEVQDASNRIGLVGDGLARNVYGRTAAEEFARANQIRQETIDNMPRGAGIVIPQQESQLDSVNAQREKLARVLERDRRPGSANRNAAYRSLQALNQLGGDLTSARNTDVTVGGRQNIAALNSQFDAANFGLDQQRTNAYVNDLANRPIQDSAAQYQRLAQSYANDRAKLLSDSLNGTADPKALADLEATYAGLMESIGFGDEFAQALSVGFADGGMVPEPMSFANGGMVPGGGALGSLGSTTPMPPAPEMLQRYQTYADSAREMGLNIVPFESFMGIQGAQPNKQVPSFADGGMVPDASGKMVIDPDPAAPTDSIPAMIDGQQPANLDSGEFVIPKDVVMYYGTDKLTKMIEKARKPEGGDGSQSVPAVQTALSVPQQ